MDKTIAKLTVFFEDPFWVGLYERQCGKGYEACKITFGPEPKSYEVYGFLLRNWGQLTFSPVLEADPSARKRVNPKRMQRAVKKQLESAGIGTKAQQALKLQQEQGKQARKERSRKQREQERERQFELRQEKKKEKHRGH